MAVVLALPLLVYALFLVVPMVANARLSLKGFGRFTGIQENWTLEHYQLIVSEPYYIKVWLNTLRVSGETAVVTVVSGVVIAYFLWRVGGWLRAYLTAAIIAPLLVSGVVRAYGWIAVTGPTGALPDITEAIGLGRRSILFNEASVVIGLVNVFLPYVVITMLVDLDGIRPSVLRAAANLGANWLQVAYRVVLPITYRSVVSGTLLVFALATEAYSIPRVLGGGRVLTVPIVIVSEQNALFNWPRAATLGIALLLVTMAVMVVYQLLAGTRGHSTRVAEI
jgi:putative spermidine/putrescine transport system permease protein